MEIEYLCAPPAPDERVGWWVRDPAGAVVDWGPPIDLEMSTEIGGTEEVRADDGSGA